MTECCVTAEQDIAAAETDIGQGKGRPRNGSKDCSDEWNYNWATETEDRQVGLQKGVGGSNLCGRCCAPAVQGWRECVVSHIATRFRSRCPSTERGNHRRAVRLRTHWSLPTALPGPFHSCEALIVRPNTLFLNARLCSSLLRLCCLRDGLAGLLFRCSTLGRRVQRQL